jgi:hypothetical protein
MDEIEILNAARRQVEEYEQHAEHEVNHRAEFALLRDDMAEFAHWGRVVVFVSDPNRRK